MGLPKGLAGSEITDGSSSGTQLRREVEGKESSPPREEARSNSRAA